MFASCQFHCIQSPFPQTGLRALLKQYLCQRGFEPSTLPLTSVIAGFLNHYATNVNTLGLTYKRHGFTRPTYHLKKLRPHSLESHRLVDLYITEKKSVWARFTDLIAICETFVWKNVPVWTAVWGTCLSEVSWFSLKVKISSNYFVIPR